MVDRPPLLIFDVESVGLHGEGFAVGWIVVRAGEETDHGLLVANPALALSPSPMQTASAMSWIASCVLPKLPPIRQDVAPAAIRDMFWARWCEHAQVGGLLMADCPWPVEARFLSDCIADDRDNRAWLGPYPLLDAAMLRYAGWAESTEDVHDPLEDARRTWQSVRDWWLAG